MAVAAVRSRGQEAEDDATQAVDNQGALSHHRATAASLGLLRIWVFGIWFVIVAFDPIERLAVLPAGLFDPPSLLGALPRALDNTLPLSTLLVGLRVMLAAGLLLVAIGVSRRRWLACLVAAGLVLHQLLVRSFSHVNHAELVLLYAAMVLALFPISDGLSLAGRRQKADVQQDRRLYALPFVLIALILALSYFATGLARLAKGPAVFTEPTLRNTIATATYEAGELVSSTPPEPGFWLGTIPNLVWVIVLVAVTLMEVAMLSVMFSVWARRLLVPTAILFHLATEALLGVSFIENVLLMVVFSNIWFHHLASRLELRWPCS